MDLHLFQEYVGTFPCFVLLAVTPLTLLCQTCQGSDLSLPGAMITYDAEDQRDQMVTSHLNIGYRLSSWR